MHFELFSNYGLAKPSSYSESTEWIFTSGVALAGLIGWLVFNIFMKISIPENVKSIN